MQFKNNTSGNGGVISLQKENKEIGRLTYTLVPDENRLIISYVMVYPEFEGKGLGKYLIDEALEFARENHWTVYPHCSYARSVMNRMSNIEDIYKK